MIYKRQNKNKININPIQAGGILTQDAKKTLIEWGDGYSVCDIWYSGKIDKIENPQIRKFIDEALPKFLGSDIVRIIGGAREGICAIMRAVTKPGDTILIDENKHYTTVLAAEKNDLKVIEVPNSGHPQYKIDVKDYEKLIKKHKPALILLTYPDGNYGNMPDAKKLGEIVSKYNIPYLLNAAYSAGRLPVSLSAINADFIVTSGHKSMASSEPIGILGFRKKWKDILFKKSSFYPDKEIEFLGHYQKGAPMMTLMASFPYVVKRVKNWEEQVEKARWFSAEMENLGFKQLGEKPHNHDLLFFESPQLYKISQKHKDGRFFLYKELKKNGIYGIKPGLTKYFKLSTFAASKQDLQKILKTFEEILRK
ncbi:O-phospho-L-seryl-tRNA:Cys-tRNA synthase [Candidatus Parcubacteria bacterium]|nr:O-phospho-L-seryl-tRNA:Cys-tRNA synthase [Candidatus Parcubacteria bacterium]